MREGGRERKKRERNEYTCNKMENNECENTSPIEALGEQKKYWVIYLVERALCQIHHSPVHLTTTVYYPSLAWLLMSRLLRFCFHIQSVSCVFVSFFFLICLPFCLMPNNNNKNYKTMTQRKVWTIHYTDSDVQVTNRTFGC